jgi:hypothetical protein
MRTIVSIGILLVLSGLVCRRAASYLVIDNAVKSDGIVVLAGDTDERYWHALRLLTKGYGRVLIVDAREDYAEFGETDAEWMQQFVNRTAGPYTTSTEVCPINGDSTQEEALSVKGCLQKKGVRKLILVTSEFHTRRALSTFGKALPQYEWSAAAVRDHASFGQEWWRHSEWAKTTLNEWAKLMWWRLIDRWQ